MYWLKTAPVGDPRIRGEEQLRVDDKGTNKQIAQAEQNKQKKTSKVPVLPGKLHINTDNTDTSINSRSEGAFFLENCFD